MSSTDLIESTIFITPEALVYQIPPLKSLTLGHKAGEWDVEKPMWRGRLKVVEIEDVSTSHNLTCELRLEDPETGELFATAPYTSQGKGVEAVRDSSRFFAITVVNGDRHATLGLGFTDRNVAFEFNIALQDFQKHMAPVSPTAEHKDFSLKQGQSIHINLGKASTITQQKTGAAEPELVPTLVPPPSSSSQPRNDPFDDDFGDFVG